jgi:hypothetical protein
LTLKDSFRDLLNNLEIELAKEDLELSLSKLRRLRPDNHGEAAKILAHCELLSRRINNLRGKPKNPQ